MALVKLSLWVLVLAVMPSEQQINNGILKTRVVNRPTGDSPATQDIERFKKLKPKKPDGKFFYQSIVISSHKPTYLIPLTPTENESNNLYIDYSDESASAPVNLRGNND